MHVSFRFIVYKSALWKLGHVEAGWLYQTRKLLNRPSSLSPFPPKKRLTRQSLLLTDPPSAIPPTSHLLHSFAHCLYPEGIRGKKVNFSLTIFTTVDLLGLFRCYVCLIQPFGTNCWIAQRLRIWFFASDYLNYIKRLFLFSEGNVTTFWVSANLSLRGNYSYINVIFFTIDKMR